MAKNTFVEEVTFKYFKGTAILTSFVLTPTLFPVILILCLNDIEFTI